MEVLQTKVQKLMKLKFKVLVVHVLHSCALPPTHLDELCSLMKRHAVLFKSIMLTSVLFVLEYFDLFFYLLIRIMSSCAIVSLWTWIFSDSSLEIKQVKCSCLKLRLG